MNLYFRLLFVLFKTLFAQRIRVLDESRLSFRVWPFDCDINFHLTNARYLALCDLSRIYYMGQGGVLGKLVKRKWLPVVQSQEISYFRAINPFQKAEVVTKLVYWDEKYWYTEHKFVVAGHICAVVQVRGVFTHGKKIVSMHDVVALAEDDVTVPEKPAIIESWQKLIDTKK